MIQDSTKPSTSQESDFGEPAVNKRQQPGRDGFWSSRNEREDGGKKDWEWSQELKNLSCLQGFQGLGK